MNWKNIIDSVDLIDLLITLHHDYRRCEQRFNRIDEPSRHREMDLRTSLDAEESSGDPSQQRIQYLRMELTELESKHDRIWSEFHDHIWPEASTWVASRTGFGSDDIEAAARAEFDASNLTDEPHRRAPSRTRKHMRKLILAIGSIEVAVWRNSNWAEQLRSEPAPAAPAESVPAKEILSEKYLRILRALRELGANSNKNRRTLQQVADQIARGSNKSLVDKYTPLLSRRGLIDSFKNRPKAGLPGGVFITRAGIAALAEAESSIQQ